MAGALAGFESYRLHGVQPTEEELSRGSYAVVLRLKYGGLECAGIKLYPVLYEHETIRRVEEECRLLAQIGHPNIVQFIGVYFEKGSRIPILVMELLSTTLAKCIDAYGVLPEEVSYSILHDVALGLYHLHSQTPPIVHRDLSANNVLLTPNMTAKISDLGVARILNLTPQQMSHMTQAPSYMPPEAMRAKHKYDTSIDKFSYGILLIHVLCGRWPLPVCEAARPDPQNPNQLIPVSEADRREEYLRDIGSTHPLMDLILRCVSNNPACRAGAAEMVQQMADMVRQFPPSFTDRLQMLQRIEAKTNEKQAMKAECRRLAVEEGQTRTKVAAKLKVQNTALQSHLTRQISTLEQEVRYHQEKAGRSELARSVEIEQTRLQLAHSEALQSGLKSQNETLQARLRSESEMHKAELIMHMESRKQERNALRSELETLKVEIAGVRQANQNSQATAVSKGANVLSKDSEVLSKRADVLATKEDTTKMVSEKERPQAVAASEEREIESKQQEVHANERDVSNSAQNELIAALRMEISAKKAALAFTDATITQKEFVLRQQSSIVQGLNKQLTKAREFLSVQNTQIAWQACSHLPVKMSSAQTVVIGQRVYCGGGNTFDDDDTDDNDEYRVFCYRPSEDAWSTLPACPVRYFGLGQVRGKLITVGGQKKPDTVTNEVYEFDEVTQSWKQSIPPMPTVRASPAVLSHHRTVIVAGGIIYSTHTSAVEIFRDENSQWYAIDPFPFAWRDAWTSLLINNRWYLLGGQTEAQVVCAHVDQLLQKTLPRDQAFTATGKDSTDDSAWEVLPNTPHYAPAVTALGASLLAIGGTLTTTDRSQKNPQPSVYAYSPCNNRWSHISNLPVPLMLAATAVLSLTEFLVIGGWNKKGSKNLVLKGFLDQD